MDSETQTDWPMKGPIISELLCWIGFVINWIDSNSIYKYCCEKFPETDIITACDLLYKLVISEDKPAFKKRISTKATDSKSVKALTNIYQIFQEYPDKVSKFKFVAADLSKLPPIPYDCVDASGLFSGYKKLESQVDIIKECSKMSETIMKDFAESQNSLLQRLSALETKVSMSNETDNKPFTCTKCDQKHTSEVDRKSQMTNHTKEKGGVNVNKGQTTNANTDQGKDTPNLGYQKNYELPKALSTCVTETGWPYSCSECGFKYQRWEELQAHFKSHT